MCSKFGQFAAIISISLSLTTAANAAEVVSLRQAQKELGKSSKLDPAMLKASNSKMAKLLAPSMVSSFKSIKSSSHSNAGSTHQKLQQFFKGVPVDGYKAIITKNAQGEVERMHGYMANGIEQDVDSVMPTVSEDDAVAAAKEFHKRLQVGQEELVFENLSKELIVHVGQDKVARLAYKISYLADQTKGGIPSRPVIFVDAKTKKVINMYNALTLLKRLQRVLVVTKRLASTFTMVSSIQN